MIKTKRFSSPQSAIRTPSSQRGAVLIMSLIILAAITLLGVTNIESSSMQMKMVTSQKERNIKFSVAESALRQVETLLETQFMPIKDDLYTDCTRGNRCFNETCANGFCFQGNYQSDTATELACEVYDDSITARRRYWEEPDIWSTSSTHKTLNSVIVEGQSYTPKYIIEFLCFVDPVANDGIDFNALSTANANNGEPLFRISVFIEGEERGKTSIMLQSTKVLDLAYYEEFLE